jgi:RNA polymerase sigma-B factor
MKAINNYDPAVGHGLAAYAQPCVSGEIKRHFRDKRWQISVQRPIQELRLQIRVAVPDLTHQLSRPPSDAELAVYLGVTEAEVTAAQLASRAFQVGSLDAPLGSEASGDTAGDLLGSEDPGLEHTIDMAAVWKHYPELPAREQRLLMMRFYGNMTQAEIGQQLDMSQMHVSRLLGGALAYLREKVTGVTEPVSE